MGERFTIDESTIAEIESAFPEEFTRKPLICAECANWERTVSKYSNSIGFCSGKSIFVLDWCPACDSGKLL